MIGGKFKHITRASKSLIKTSGDIVNDIATSLANIIGGVTNGLSSVAGQAGTTLNSISSNLAIVSTKVFYRVGDLGLTIANELGEIIVIIPLLGLPTSYVVKGAGKGIYYVVTTVGNIVGESVKTIGKLGTSLSNVVVFTIVSTSEMTENTIKEAGNVVKRVTYLVNNKKTQRKKTYKRKKTHKRKYKTIRR
jgi:hypothetical protein